MLSIYLEVVNMKGMLIKFSKSMFALIMLISIIGSIDSLDSSRSMVSKTKFISGENLFHSKAYAMGKKKQGRELKYKGRQKSNFNRRKDQRAKKPGAHTPSKKHKDGKKTRGSNKKRK